MFNRSSYWPDLSVHQQYWETHHNPYVYEYDPADNGPEVEAITRILASHPTLDVVVQKKVNNFIELLAEVSL